MKFPSFPLTGASEEYRLVQAWGTLASGGSGSSVSRLVVWPLEVNMNSCGRLAKFAFMPSVVIVGFHF